MQLTEAWVLVFYANDTAVLPPPISSGNTSLSLVIDGGEANPVRRVCLCGLSAEVAATGPKDEGGRKVGYLSQM
jgi:hypothetical protein